MKSSQCQILRLLDLHISLAHFLTREMTIFSSRFAGLNLPLALVWCMVVQACRAGSPPHAGLVWKQTC